jgi:aerobic-type carbon monoxide dehydrogenase small subunit (CoxS/CutS family)
MSSPQTMSTATTQLTVNGKSVSVDADPQTPLLWVLRDHLQLTGTKFGCGQAVCGACTVHLNSKPIRSCAIMLGDAAGKKVTTIEGLGAWQLHPLQAAWIKHQVPQCGYCQPGFIMAAAALLKEKPNASEADIEAAINNVCRCGTYARIRHAIQEVANQA